MQSLEFVVAWSQANVGGSWCAGPFFPRSRTVEEREGTRASCTICRHSMLPFLQKYVFDCDLIKASLATVQVWLSGSLCCGLRMWCRVFRQTLWCVSCSWSFWVTSVLSWTTSYGQRWTLWTKIPEKKLAITKKLGVCVSAETYEPIGISVVWRDWDFVGSEAN